MTKPDNAINNRDNDDNNPVYGALALIAFIVLIIFGYGMWRLLHE